MDWNRRQAEVDNTLRSLALVAERTGQADWDFIVRNGGAMLGNARLLDDWLLLDLPYDGALDGAQAWKLARLNAVLPGHAKFCLRRRALRLRAEIAVTEESNLALRLKQALSGFEQALLLAEAGPPPAGESAPDTPGGECAHLAGLLEEAGWPAVQRDVQRYAVELDAGGRGYHQALIEQANGGLRITAQLVHWKNAAEVLREALGAFLLTANWAVRLARAAAADAPNTRAWFEVVYQGKPGPAELDRALAALSVACRLASREAAALEDPELARHYLAISGFPTEQLGG